MHQKQGTHQIPPERLRGSHITQYRWGYCKSEYRWGYYEGTLTLLWFPPDQLRGSHITQYRWGYCKSEYRWGYYEGTLTLLWFAPDQLRGSHITQYRWGYCKSEYLLREWWGHSDATVTWATVHLEAAEYSHSPLNGTPTLSSYSGTV